MKRKKWLLKQLKKIFIKKFRETHSHLDSRVIYILEKLLKNNVKLNLDHENTRYLKKNEWILLIDTLPSNTGLFKIQPLIAEELTNINEEIFALNINCLVDSELNGCKEIIRIFSHPNYHLENHEIIEDEYFESRAIILKCFYVNERRDYLYIKWRDGYKKVFENLTDTKVRDDCEVALTKKSFSVGLNSTFRQ